ncbi:MAG TPA: CBS domain-containing protein [Methanomassiliicoccales archaeon]|nr:CBS domain-containing protein [Methanomassiliicoccales archaeon]
MKFPPATDIKRLRKALDLTQIELSAMSGISQSTIAKIENGTINGSYHSVVRMFEALQDEMDRRRKGRQAKDVMSRSIVSIQSGEKVKRATEIMRESGYSQLPVFDGTRPVGSISEFGVLALLGNGTSMESAGEREVRQVMGQAFPVVNEETPLPTVTSLLASASAVLVANRGHITGIITSADVLKLL